MTSGVGFGNVANFSYTYPGLSLGVVSDANNGYGSALGDGDVIVRGGVDPTAYFIAMENSGYVLQENGSKIQLEN